MQDMQMRAAKDNAQFEIDKAKLQLQMSKQEQEFAAKMGELEAKTNLMQAQTAEILASIGLDMRKQELDEYREANAQQQRQVDTALRVKSEGRADRQQAFGEAQSMNNTREGVE
jgi:hypothetical protein